MKDMLPINHNKLDGERALLKDDQPNIPRIENDLLRIQIINTVGNFKSTPCRMGDNLEEGKNKYYSESNTFGNKGSSCQKINSAGGHKR